MGGNLYFRQTTGFDGELGKVMTDVVGEGLSVGRGSGTAAPNMIVKLCDFIGGTVGDVGSGGDTRVYARNKSEEMIFRVNKEDKQRTYLSMLLPFANLPAQRTTPPSNCTAMMVVPVDNSPGFR